MNGGNDVVVEVLLVQVPSFCFLLSPFYSPSYLQETVSFLFHPVDSTIKGLNLVR